MKYKKSFLILYWSFVAVYSVFAGNHDYISNDNEVYLYDQKPVKLFKGIIMDGSITEGPIIDESLIIIEEQKITGTGKSLFHSCAEFNLDDAYSAGYSSSENPLMEQILDQCEIEIHSITDDHSFNPPIIPIKTDIANQCIYPSIKRVILPLDIQSTLPEIDAQSYTLTYFPRKESILPDEQVTIESSGIDLTINIDIPYHRYGTELFLFTIFDGSDRIGEAFKATIKYPQISHIFSEETETSISPKTSVIRNDFIYEVNSTANCIIKKDLNYKEVLRWGQYGEENGAFDQPTGLAIDSDGFIYVTDSGNHRIQVFTAYGEFLTSFGEYGHGQVSNPTYIEINENDTIYIAEANKNTVKEFQRYDYTEGITKAIIVAGGGPYTGNTIWNATKTCANLACRALIHQGLNKEKIQYLSSESKDENELVDYPATNANIKYAITQWAAGESINDDNIRADSLVIYMVDHGGDGNFRVNESEYISATILSLWFDDIQQHIPGKLIVIYDACQSGSFMKYLSDIPRNRERILITSSGYDESAIFIGNGALSFSSYFWAAIFNGKDIKDAFHSAQKINDFKYDNVAIFPQNPQINVNGNTINNETIDINAMQNVIIGNGVGLNFGLPFIQKISPEQTIAKSSSADITATGVWPKDGVSRVWAQIMPSGYTQTAINKPLIALPSVELTKTDDEMYKGTFNDFTHEGTYLIAVYAKDTNGLVSYPRLTTVIVQKPLRRRGIILMGESDVESLTAVKENAEFASKALRTQAYFDIIKIDGSSSETDCLDNIFNNCIEGKEKEILLYMIGNGNETKFVLSNVEVEKSISQDHLKTLLERVPDDIRVTIIYDGPHSQQFLEGLKPITEKNRIFVSSSSSENAFSYLNGKLSFSRYFWSMVYNGETLLRSFNDASNCIFTVFRNHQTPMIVYGRDLAQTHTFGYGIRFGDDIPLLTSVSAKYNPFDNSLHIQANNVNSLRSIEKVFALIARKDHFQTKDNINLIELKKIPGSNNYSVTYVNCPKTGHYDISVCAIDSAGNMSYPMVTTVMQKSNIYNIISTLQILSGFKEEKLDVSPFDTNKEVRIDLKSVIHMMKCL